MLGYRSFNSINFLTMKLTTRHLGAYGGNPSSIIELTVEDWQGNFLVESLTNSKYLVEKAFITSLRDLADELEEHNSKILGDVRK